MSSDMIKHLQIKPLKRVFKGIEMIMHAAAKWIEIYEAEISDLAWKFKMIAKFNIVNENVLLKLLNPRNEHLQNKY